MKVVRIQNLGSIMIIGVLVGLCSWAIEAAVHSFILREGRLSVQMFYPALGEVWHRLAMAVCFVGLGAYAQSQLVARRRAEVDFRQLESTFGTIFEKVNDGILIADAATRKFVEVNRTMCDMLGYSREEVLDLGIENIHPPQDLPAVFAAFERYVLINEKVSIDLPVMRKDGSVFYADIGHSTVSLNGRHCAVGIFRDITERKQAEEVLAQSRQQLEEMVSDRTRELQDAIILLQHEIGERKKTEEALRDSWNKFRQLAENINEVFWIQDAHTRQILYISPAYEAIWGKTCESLYERPESLFDSVQPDDTERVASAVRKQRNGILFNEEFRIIRPDGSVRWIWARTFPVCDTAGETIRYAGIAEDITEQRLAREKLRDYADRLQSLSRGLVEAQESERRSIARELHDEIGQLATGLKVGLDVMSRTISGNEAAQVKHLQTTAAELLARARNLSLSLRPSMLDDLGLLPALVWHFDRYTALTGIKVRFTQNGMDRRLPPEVETAFYRVTQEALTNVARHAGIQSVGVEISASGRASCLTIEDEGSGFRTESVVRGNESIGLFGMRERAESVGGALFIRSSPGRGTTISFSVPLLDNEAIGE